MGSRVLVDTNILIDQLAGVEAARVELRRYEDRAVSVISRIEMFVGLREGEAERAEGLMGNFVQIELTPDIAEETVRVRRTTRLKLADAVLLATARVEKRVLLTRNTRDFKPGQYVRIPYKL